MTACTLCTVKLSVAAACSLELVDSVSWPGETSGHEAAGCYWEETNQCRATAAPSLSPHCTCTQTQQQYVESLKSAHLSELNTVCRICLATPSVGLLLVALSRLRVVITSFFFLFSLKTAAVGTLN